MLDFLFIVNPKAGRNKRDPRIAEKIKGFFSTRKQDQFEIIYSEYPGHATELAQHASAKVVVAVGGDGTVQEVVNGIFGTAKSLGIVPVGSGNDFIKSIGIPANLTGALLLLSSQKSKRIDCGIVRCQTQSDIAERLFINGVGIGFDAAVAERTTHIENLSGTMLYLTAVFQTLGKYKSPAFKIRLDSTSYESYNLLIAIGNGRCAGGGFYLTPDSEVDDGLMDICMVEEMSIARILHLMPKVMKGKHAGVRGVRFAKAKEISVEADKPFFVHADGEIVGRSVHAVHVETRERSLSVISAHGQ